MAKKKLNIDTEAAAQEIKNCINEKKFDMVDYSLVELECYPPPDDKNYPEISKLSEAWGKFFDAADLALAELPDEEVGTTSFEEVLKKHEPKLAADLAQYDEITAKIAAAVNADEEFWAELRKVVIPLYERSPHYADWQKRWQKIDLVYDPVGLDVVTTQMWTNKETGERIRGEKLRTTSYPAGFIVKMQ